MPGPDDVAKLTAELAKMQTVMKEQEEALQYVVMRSKEQGEALAVALKQTKESEGMHGSKPLIVLSSRRIERFRDKPEKTTDPTIQEWVADVRNQAAAKKLEPVEYAAFIRDHLGGKARQEIAGRGSSLESKPEETLSVLLQVFGDGYSLPMLQQQFYAYKQEEEDILTCSLKLVELYDRIVTLDASFQPCREAAMKGRFAEAVLDEGLRRELRRLNEEAPTLTFFAMRDRAIKWLGSASAKKVKVINQEAAVAPPHPLEAIVKRQEDLIAQQQTQIDALMRSTTAAPARGYRSYEPRKCWTCGSTDHLRSQCPTTPQQSARGKNAGAEPPKG
jgi:FAD/FMN-containing dehydrogenase